MKPDDSNPTGGLGAVAADWAGRCAAGLSTDERRQFEQWVKADPSHRRAFAEANRNGADCDWAWQAAAADEILAGLKVRAKRRRRRRTVAGVAAALLIAVSGLVWQMNQPATPAGGPPGSSLVVVAPEKMLLPDGSLVELKDGAQLAADFSGPMRAVSLTRGTAFFQVAKDPARPFVVRAGGMAVQAVGTAFTVGLAEEEVTVLVAEGQVRVDATESAPATEGPRPEPLVSLTAGDSVVLPVTAVPADKPVVKALDLAAVQEQNAWRIPKLEFSATPLREVVAQMNRHNARRLVLGDEAVGDLRVSGVLRADKMDTLADTLETDFGVTAERREGQIILRRLR